MAYSLNLPALSPPFIACSVILTDPLNISHLSVKVLLGAQSCLTLVTPWTVARQAPLSLEVFRHEHWSGWPCPPPGGLPRGWPRSPASQADALPSESPGLLRFVPGMKLSFISRGRERDPAVEAWVWGDAGATLAGREADTTSASTPSSSRKLLACRSGLGPAPLPAPPRGSQPREHSPSSASQAPCLQRSLDFSPGKGVLPLPDDSLAALNPRGRDVPCTCSSPTFSVQFSCSVSDSLRPHEPQHARPPCPSPTPGVYPNSCPWSRWCLQPSHPLSSPSPPAPNPSQHQGQPSLIITNWHLSCSNQYVIFCPRSGRGDRSSKMGFGRLGGNLGLDCRAERQRIDAFECSVGEDSWESLRLQGDPNCPS